MAEVSVRPQRTPDDLDPIRAVNDAAFDRHGQTQAFDEFRKTRDDIISLVAVARDKVIGHVLFCPARLEAGNETITGMGLGQLAIAPDFQRQGIGQRLTHQGLKILREAHCPFVIVVGHASYYPRFGFEPGSQHGLKCQWPGIPDDSFMVLYPEPELQPAATGTVYFDGM